MRAAVEGDMAPPALRSRAAMIQTPPQTPRLSRRLYLMPPPPSALDYFPPPAACRRHACHLTPCPVDIFTCCVVTLRRLAAIFLHACRLRLPRFFAAAPLFDASQRAFAAARAGKMGSTGVLQSARTITIDARRGVSARMMALCLREK
jgi:hypothetical protein